MIPSPALQGHTLKNNLRILKQYALASLKDFAVESRKESR